MNKTDLEKMLSAADVDVVLDAEKWLWLDFRKHIAMWGSRADHVHCEPASVWVADTFAKEFLKKGKNSCSFAELKELCYFNGVKKNGVVYAFIPLTDINIYLSMLNNTSRLSYSSIRYYAKGKKKLSMEETFLACYKQSIACLKNNNSKGAKTEIVDKLCEKLKKMLLDDGDENGNN